MQFGWTAPDGDVFPCEKWSPPGESSRAVVICVHGMGGAAEEFAPLAEMAMRENYCCYGLNLRGQGNDPRSARRGHYLDVSALCREIAAFTHEVTSRHAGQPVFLCGESMGALLVCRTVASRHLDVDGIILSAPVVQLRKPTPRPVREALRWLSRLAPGLRFNHSLFVSGKQERLRVSRDEAHLDRIRAAPHAIRAYSLGFLSAMGDLIDSCAAAAREVDVPCLVLAAGHDVFLRADQVEQWYGQLASADKTFRLYPEAYHCLWNDWEREAVLGDIATWLAAHTERPQWIPGSDDT